MIASREDQTRRNRYEVISEFDAISLWVEYRLFRIHTKCRRFEVRPVQGDTRPLPIRQYSAEDLSRVWTNLVLLDILALEPYLLDLDKTLQ